MTAETMRTSRLTIATALALALSALPIRADIAVVVTAPALKPGMSRLQTMLEQQVGGAAETVAALAADYLAKPFLMGALARANATVAAPAVAFLRSGDAVSVALGAYAAVELDTWDFAEVGRRIEGFSVEDDWALGAAARPISLDVRLPLRILGGRLGLGLSGSFMRAEVEGYTFRSLGAGATATVTLAQPRGRAAGARWDGVAVSVGAAVAGNRLATVVAPGVVAQSLAFDPDGAGPLPVYDVVVSVDPQIEAAVSSRAAVFPLALSTGATLLDTFSVLIGVGADLSTGETAIALAGSPEVSVQGYLAELVETPGRIEVSGSVAGRASLGLRPFALVELVFRAGPSYLALCLAWRHPVGLAVGAAMGVSLR